MSGVILVFGAVFVLAGLFVACRSSLVFAYAARYSDHRLLWLAAIVLRLVLGVALITYAASSRFPLALSVLGWISIVAAVLLLCIGRQRLARLVNWAIGFARPFALVAGLLAAALGGFLIYAVVT